MLICLNCIHGVRLLEADQPIRSLFPGNIYNPLEFNFSREQSMRSSRLSSHMMELVQLLGIPRDYLNQTTHAGGILNSVFPPRKAIEQQKDEYRDQCNTRRDNSSIMDNVHIIISY